MYVRVFMIQAFGWDDVALLMASVSIESTVIRIVS
jgi:hypothetical protein